MNLSSYQFLVLAIIYSPARANNYEDWKFIEPLALDLGLDYATRNSCLFSLKDKVFSKAKQYEELCLDCLQPTGWGPSWELQIMCKNCSPKISKRSFLLEKYLHLTDYKNKHGENKRFLHQLIYQSLELVGVAK